MFRFIWYYYPSAIAIAIFTFLLLLRLKRKNSTHPYPPGPKGLPLLGNIYDIPRNYEWVTYAQWSRQYNSGIIHLKLLDTHLVVVNSAGAASELFEKRSTIYSDRPRLPMLTELIGFDILTFHHYGEKWRTSRRMFHQFFNSKAVANFEPQQTRAAHDFLSRLAHTPEDLREHIRLMAGSLILNITYGIDVQSADNPYILMLEGAMDAMSEAGNPGSFLVDMVPILKYVPEWVPGAGFQTKAKEWRKVVEASADLPYQYVKEAMAKGTYTPSITSHFLEGKKETEDFIRRVSGVAYIAGGDTTVSSLYTFFLAMVIYPDVVRKAQEELDDVIGQDRLPKLSDRSSLPYICAIVKEVLRWIPVAPLGVVHRLMEDDVYEGTFLPAGSLVLGNTWAILHDENIYKDPETFNPDRFMKDGQLDPDIRPPETAVFGFGRRICPGLHLAVSSIFLNVACILAVFNIGKALDEDGKPITPKPEFTTGLLCHPLPFKYSIKPRSAQASSLIAEASTMHNP